MSGVRKLMSFIVLQPLCCCLSMAAWGKYVIFFFFHFPRIYFAQSSFYFSCNRLAYLSCKSKQIHKHWACFPLVCSFFRCCWARVHKTKDRVLKWFTAIMLHNRPQVIRSQPFIFTCSEKYYFSIEKRVCWCTSFMHSSLFHMICICASIR